MTLKAMNRLAETVPVSLLREAVRYDPVTGGFLWRERPAEHFPEGVPSPEVRAAMWNGKYAGKPAFTSRDPRGYLRGAVRGLNLYAHRAAVAYVTGEWPPDEVDHINRDKSDNRLKNLRAASHRENRLNTDDCDRPHRGIYQMPNGRWRVQIKRQGQSLHLGTYDSLDDALEARSAA